ncbi:Aminomethyltransferase [Methylacidiphilum fumariolicum SolV]|uniref:aminomethyltransferase n=2 Tax=Candidatus Methylacidiphilum fumarolicum TaxID=591154 RepID=I0JVK5_METFB|nr:glycine cleavage system aminomethyltransferase GcvT [Candidatus Methylacidiphilum fumarolicum]CAI9084602.1 Glycine cleavage system T protein [Candidatus Methylacidiphilum fumarolicum]CCG91274.1 Aminomethyltransferase [Methylacidiphilum fumariolicum SolV]
MIAPSGSVPFTTFLYNRHIELGAYMGTYSGWWMPIYYTSAIKEHQAVRENSGIFDLSHMGQFFVEGPKAMEWLNGILTNDLSLLKDSESQYHLILSESGGIIDDLILYRIGSSSYLLVVNACASEKDYSLLHGYLPFGDVSLIDNRRKWGCIAIQGPTSWNVLKEVFSLDPIPKHTIKKIIFEKEFLYIAATGYTGEDGAELFFPGKIARQLWDHLLEAGKPYGLLPCGLASRNILRLEASLPLNGVDLREDKTPWEAGLSKAVSLSKPYSFPGKAALVLLKDSFQTLLVAFVACEEASPQPKTGSPIFFQGQKCGEVTSGIWSPSLGRTIGMGYVHKSYALIGNKIEIEIRNKLYPFEIRKKPLYKRPTIHR